MTTQAPGGSLDILRQNYRPAFLAHLTSRDEATLRLAYELGRQAVATSASMLDMVQIHHEVFADVVATLRDVDELPDLLAAATTFLVESLAPFEMTRNPVGLQGT